jgi:hypothetical protein
MPTHDYMLCPTSNAVTFSSLVLIIILVAYRIDSGINVNDCVHTCGSKLCLKEQANTVTDTN